MLDKRILNQIENDDWNKSNDSESEIETIQKKLLNPKTPALDFQIEILNIKNVLK